MKNETNKLESGNYVLDKETAGCQCRYGLPGVHQAPFQHLGQKGKENQLQLVWPLEGGVP
jgi:hypothetical protein